MELWMKFSPLSRRAVLLAHNEAARRGLGEIGTEQMLLGLVRIEEGKALEALKQMKLDLARLEKDALDAVEAGPGVALSQEIAFSGPAQAALQLAYVEHRNLKDDHIDTQHILLGLIRSGGKASEVLRRQGVTPERVQGALTALDTRGAMPAPAATRASTGGARTRVETGEGGFEKVFEVPGRYVNDHCLIHRQSLHHIFYIDGEVGKGCYDLGNETIIGHATSSDLRRWTVRDPALVHKPELPWEERGIFAPCVVEHDGVFNMLYTSHNMAKAQFMCLATSRDLVHWNRPLRRPLFVPSAQWARWRHDAPCSCRDPHVLRHPDYGFILYWVADMQGDDRQSCIAASVSRDLQLWQEVGPVLIRRPGELDAYSCKTESPCVVQRGVLYYLFFRHGNGTRVCVSTDPLDFRHLDSELVSTAHAAEVFESGGQWYITNCSRPAEDVTHAHDRTSGLYIARLDWPAGELPRVSVA